jgi:hypothetical protein
MKSIKHWMCVVENVNFTDGTFTFDFSCVLYCLQCSFLTNASTLHANR